MCVLDLSVCAIDHAGSSVSGVSCRLSDIFSYFFFFLSDSRLVMKSSRYDQFDLIRGEPHIRLGEIGAMNQAVELVRAVSI